jgi:nicotinate-nucleotide adenylyltransferase
MRLGIFGGSFEPVHYGHLLLAESCREQARLDEIWFVPAAVPPHKRSQELTADKHRVEMLRLAIGGHEAFAVSTAEIDRGGVTYTFETLEALHHERPSDELFFLMGADSLRDLPTWRRPERICELAIPLVAHRPDSPAVQFDALSSLVPPEQLIEFEKYSIEMPLVDFSSTEIRRRVAAGQSIRYRTPAAVVKYIETHGLYRQL